jgi:two-component system LytT family response regulator
MKIRTLIVDDQVIACEALRRLLKDEPDLEIVGTCQSGQEAVDAIRKLSPDLVFLDVRLPDQDGFEVLARIEPAKMPVVVFVTATDDFAVKAFAVHALDYLVKPCDRERLQESLQRARQQIQQREAGHEVNEQLATLLNELRATTKPADRVAVKSGGRVLFLKPDEIHWVEAADNYVKLHIAGEAHLVRETMSDMEARLPSSKFVRISRSVIVNLEKIKELQPMFHGEYTVILCDGTRLTLSRNYRDKLKQLGLT